MRAYLPLFLVLLSVHLAVLTLCAPRIKADGSVYTTAEMRDFVIPHGAPLYPLFVRGINAVVHNGAVWLGFLPDAESPNWSMIRPAPYSDVSIYAILLIQHVLLAWAASWFAITITQRRWLRLVTGGVLCWSPPILAVAQRIMTEGLWNPLVIAVVGSGYRFLAHSERRLRNLALHFVFVTLAMLVRHPGSVYLAVLPLAFLCLGVARALGDRGLAAGWPAVRASLVVTGFGLVTLGVVSQVKTAVLLACDVEPRPAFGRLGMQRIHPQALHPYDGISRQELDEVIQGLEQRTDDPQVRQAIRIITTSKSFWVEPFNRVRTEIIEPAFPQYNFRQTLAPTDRLLNRVAVLAYTSTDPRMLQSIALRATRFLQLGQGLQKCGVGSFPSLAEQIDQAGAAAQWPWIRDGLLANVASARNLEKLRRGLALEWFAAQVRPPEARLLWFSIAALTVLVIVRGRFRAAASTAIAVVATTWIYAFLSALVGCYSARRSEIIVLLAVCAAALLASELFSEPARASAADEHQLR